MSVRRKGRPNSNGTQSVGPDTLIEAVCELLKTLPPEKISRAVVARAANVDPTLIRYYFRNNHSLLRATAVALSQRFQQLADSAIEPDAPTEVRLRTRIETFLRFQTTYPFYHRLMIEELWGSGDEEARALLHQVSSRGAAGYQHIINAGVTKGEMRAVDPFLFHLCIIGFVEVASIGRPILLANAHPAANSPMYVSVIADFLTDLLVNGLKARWK